MNIDIKKNFLSLLVGYEQPSAILNTFTAPHGPFRWYGVIVGRYFFGVMKCTIHRVDKDKP